LNRVDLATLPNGLRLRSVTANSATIAGRTALRVSLAEEIAVNGKYGVDFVDMPTFALLPATIRNGTISVDIFARLADNAPDFARAFAGIAYRVVNGGERFESVYLRPLNGLKLNPPPPRNKRALQYFAYPDWRFERLREEYPDGRYEAGADIGSSEWTNLTVDLQEMRLRVTVNGVVVMSLDQTKADPVEGSVGLFVDIGTEAFFSDLRLDRKD
jgi:hypothetical protein